MVSVPCEPPCDRSWKHRTERLLICSRSHSRSEAGLRFQSGTAGFQSPALPHRAVLTEGCGVAARGTLGPREASWRRQ